MSSLIKEVDEKGNTKEVGVFNPAQKYALTNITNEDFKGSWNGRVVVELKPGQTVELPHYLANKFVDELVDKIMIGEIKADETEIRKLNPADRYAVSPKASSLGVPAARKVWEDRMLRKIAIDPSEPQFKILAAQVKEELEADMAKEPGGDVALAQGALVTEFADLTK